MVIKIGDRRMFVYQCQESHDSADAELWYRTLRPAVVLRENTGEQEDPELRSFRVRFDDGFEGTALEDELFSKTKIILSPDKVRRTNPPRLGPDFTIHPRSEWQRRAIAACSVRVLSHRRRA